MAINACFQRNPANQIVECDGEWLFDKAIHRDLPRPDDEILRVRRDVLARAELVEIVVVAVDLLRRDRLVDLVGFVSLGRIEVGCRVALGACDTGLHGKSGGEAQAERFQD